MVQLCGGRVEVILKHVLNLQGGAGTVLAVADSLQVLAEIAPHKAFGTGHKDLHAFSASISFRAFRT